MKDKLNYEDLVISDIVFDQFFQEKGLKG